MLSDFQRDECRSYKKMLDAAETPQGKIAVELAKAKHRNQADRGKILKLYSGQAKPPETPKQEIPVSPILKHYLND